MKLYCNGALFGLLTNYTYDTPWAYASIEPVDGAAYRALGQASYLVNVVLAENWSDLTAEEEDRTYERWLAQLGISEADHPDRQGLISLYECNSAGWIRWRW